MVYHKRVNVTTAGTAVPLATVAQDIAAAGFVSIQARSTNTGTIYIGSSTVPNNHAGGFEINVGDTAVAFPTGAPGVWDLKSIFINSDVDGEGVNVLYGR